MDKIYNMLLAGVGGQGIILASDIICQAAMNAGYDTKKSEIHGMSQRGGSVFSHIRFGGKVYSPVIAKKTANLIVALEEMEIIRWLEYAAVDTQMLILKNRILPAGVENYPEGTELFIKNKFPNSFFLIPDEVILRCLGVDNKYMGVVYASIAGSITLMPGFIAFPLCGILLTKQVPYMILSAFTTTLMMVGILTFPVEKEYFGIKVAVIRNLAGLLIALIVAFITGIMFGEIF